MTGKVQWGKAIAVVLLLGVTTPGLTACAGFAPVYARPSAAGMRHIAVEVPNTRTGSTVPVGALNAALDIDPDELRDQPASGEPEQAPLFALAAPQG